MKYLILVIPVLFLLANFYFWFTLGRQKEGRQTSRQEVLFAKVKIIRADTTKLAIATGEVDDESSEKLSSAIRSKLESNSLQSLTFITPHGFKGKTLSWMKRLHRDFPNKVTIHVSDSADSLDGNFILTDDMLHVERRDASASVLIERPNRWMKKRYENKIEDLLAQE